MSDRYVHHFHGCTPEQYANLLALVRPSHALTGGSRISPSLRVLKTSLAYACAPHHRIRRTIQVHMMAEARYEGSNPRRRLSLTPSCA